MTKKLLIKQIGLVRQVGAKSEIKKIEHPPSEISHYPRVPDTDICTGSDHLTFVTVSDWSAVSGVFDPFSLSEAVLKRLNSTDAETTQSSLSLEVDTTYQLGLTGAGLIIFENGNNYEWGTGALGNSEMMNNQTTTVVFRGSAPDKITIKLVTDDQQIEAISLTDPEGNEIIRNNDFINATTHFYGINAWYVATKDERIVPRDTLGYLQGFNDDMIYTVFEYFE